MIMDAMRMSQGYANECSIVDEESNVDAIRFLDLLKDFDEPLWYECINHSKLSTVAQVYTIKLDHKLREADYYIIIEWEKHFTWLEYDERELSERKKTKRSAYTFRKGMREIK